MNVPFVDLQRLHGALRDDLLAAFARVLDSGGYVQGRETAAFEEEFAAALGVEHALTVNSGTAALHLALLACGVGPGHEVITVANTFIATAEAITMVGATPVFADIDPASLTIDPADVERRITTRTRAIIAVHLYGRTAHMAALSAIARRHGLRLIEDACQAHGATNHGRVAGTIGDAGVFSFYPTKNLGTVGEGGMLVTRDPVVARRAARLRDHGQEGRHHHVVPGFNYRISELQAAALRVFLPHLAAWNAARVDAARRYDARLAGSSIATPDPGPAGEHVYHLYVVRSPRRDALRIHLATRGVATAIHYPTPIHLQPAYAAAENRPGSLPHTEAAVREILSLPMHPGITPGEIDAVCEAVHEFEAGAHSRTLQEVTG
ncbi:MAG: DegT/DnrJ/EryC1/StrS family aminotransferase [Dehalococcoidia bacterium]